MTCPFVTTDGRKCLYMSADHDGEHMVAPVPWEGEDRELEATVFVIKSAGTGSDQVRIEARDFDEHGNVTQWAVCDAFKAVLNRDGTWQYEPNPSSRTPEFLEQTRWSTVQEALRAYHARKGD